MRHGIAEDAGPRTGGRDEPRALTAAGAARMEEAARGVVALGLRPDAVASSPLVRCRQTAEIVGAALGVAPREHRALRPGMGLDDLEDVLLEHPGAGSVLVCGHQPDLSRAVGDLTGGGLVEFAKGALAVLVIARPRPGGGVLTALYPPDALRRLGS